MIADPRGVAMEADRVPPQPVSLRHGVLPDHDVKGAIMRGWIRPSAPLAESQIQPASLDLRLGGSAYQLRASFLPGNHPVERRLGDSRLVIDELPLTAGANLQRGVVYLIPLQERLALPGWLHGRCSPKSTTGRLGLFTRVVTDYGLRFDDIPPGYEGPLYLEMCPQTFPVRVTAGLCLSQLRLAHGVTRIALDELRERHEEMPLLYDRDGRQLDGPRTWGGSPDGLTMSLDLSGTRTGGLMGYRTHPHPPPLDLTRIGAHDPRDFFEPIPAPGPLLLEPNRFYILVSAERVCIPPDLAAEMLVFDAGAGEMRTHYAGFFDPGFGAHDGTPAGTPAVLEACARETPFFIEDGQPLFTLTFERMRARPFVTYGAARGSHYHAQGLTLSKHFRAAEA